MQERQKIINLFKLLCRRENNNNKKLYYNNPDQAGTISCTFLIFRVESSTKLIRFKGFPAQSSSKSSN